MDGVLLAISIALGGVSIFTIVFHLKSMLKKDKHIARLSNDLQSEFTRNQMLRDKVEQLEQEVNNLKYDLDCKKIDINWNDYIKVHTESIENLLPKEVESLASKIREIRIHKKLSQRDAATLCGMSRTVYTKLERGDVVGYPVLMAEYCMHVLNRYQPEITHPDPE